MSPYLARGRSRAVFLTAALTLGLPGCIGNIGSDSDDHGGFPKPGTQGACGAEPEPVRRLSRAEYLATIHDLFPSIDISQLTIGKDPTDHGFENRAELLNPQPMLIEQYSDAAADIAAALIADPSSILPCTPADTTESACAAQFVETVGERVFRRPLTDDEKKTYTDFLSSERTAGADFNGAVQLTLEALLQAPQFLSRLEFGTADSAPDQARHTSYEVATRMSYLLWGS